MLRWTALHCPRARFLLKLDDDSYLRPRPFLEWLKTVPANRFYGTHVLQPGSRPVQREDSRWALSRRYYPPSTYPAYQNGVYLLPANLSVHLYEAIVQEEVPGLTLPALPFEDVYINGVLGKVVRLAHAQVDNIRQTRGVHIVEVDRLQGVHLLFDYLNSSDIRHYWKVWQ